MLSIKDFTRKFQNKLHFKAMYVDIWGLSWYMSIAVNLQCWSISIHVCDQEDCQEIVYDLFMVEIICEKYFINIYINTRNVQYMFVSKWINVTKKKRRLLYKRHFILVTLTTYVITTAPPTKYFGLFSRNHPVKAQKKTFRVHYDINQHEHIMYYNPVCYGLEPQKTTPQFRHNNKYNNNIHFVAFYHNSL